VRYANSRITRGRACAGKKELSRRGAEREVARLEAAGAAEGALMAYPCPFGDHWHTGHIPGRRRDLQNRRTR